MFRFSQLSLAAVCLALLAPTVSPAAETPLPQTSLGWSVGFDSPQIMIADSLSLWKPAGVDLTPVTFGSGRAALEALLGGQVDFVVAAELPAVTAAMRNQPVVVVADLSRYNGNRIVATGPITAIGDLKDRKVGTTIGTSSQFILDNELHRAGIKPEEVNAAPSDLVPALAHGDIAAASMFSDFYPQAKKVLGDRYHELHIPEVTHLLVLATRDVVTKRPDVVKNVLRAMLAADDVLKNDPAKARAIMSSTTKGTVSVDELKAVWPEYEFQVRLDQPLVDLMTVEGQWVLDGGMIKNVAISKALFRSYVDDAPLKALAPSRVSVR